MGNEQPLPLWKLVSGCSRLCAAGLICQESTSSGQAAEPPHLLHSEEMWLEAKKAMGPADAECLWCPEASH